MVLEEVDRQKMALGETPLLDKNRSLAPATDIDIRNATLIKQNNGQYVVRATVNGSELNGQPVERNTALLYLSLKDSRERERLLAQAVVRAYGQGAHEADRKEGYGLKR